MLFLASLTNNFIKVTEAFNFSVNRGMIDIFYNFNILVVLFQNEIDLLYKNFFKFLLFTIVSIWLFINGQMAFINVAFSFPENATN